MRPALLLPLLLAACAGDAGRAAARVRGDVVQVVVAANVREAFEELRAMYAERQPGVEVRPTYTASGAAYQQILAGAPFDLFLSADSAYPAALDSAGRAEPGTRRSYAEGALSLWVSSRLPADVRDVGALAGDAVRRVAIANPATAPYGRAAREALARAGALAAVEPKLVFGQDVGQAAQIALAGADAALLPTALTRVPAFTEAGRTYPVPRSLHTPITQSLAIVRGRASPAVREFAGFLASEEARAVFERYGYRAVSSEQ